MNLRFERRKSLIHNQDHGHEYIIIDFSYYAGKKFKFLNSSYTFKVIYFSLITAYSLFHLQTWRGENILKTAFLIKKWISAVLEIFTSSQNLTMVLLFIFAKHSLFLLFKKDMMVILLRLCPVFISFRVKYITFP